MSDSANKAVFLSYASQDKEVASRICDALRAVGVEVWFDQSELRGGDAWDQKIRRQIKECALFVPLITANTNARPEGYFRLEWKLAVDRSHLMADDQPFLFPIITGDLSDATARVPDKFRDVQWTRLRLDETPAELGARVARLLSGVGGVLHPDSSKPSGYKTPPTTKHSWQWWMIFPIAGSIMALLFAARPIWKSMNRPPSAAPISNLKSDISNAAPSAPSETGQLVARIYGLCTQLNYTRDDLGAAEDLARKASDKYSDSAAAWAARAYVQSCYVVRGWDTSEKRREDTQTFARRALALDGNDTNAMLALAYVLNAQRGYAQAEAMARRAIALKPDDSRLHTVLVGTISGQGRTDEAIALGEETVRRFPNEPLVHYALANGYRTRGRFDEALASYDRALAIQSFSSALLYKAIILVAARGDVAGARAALDQVALVDRPEDRAVGVAMWIALLEHRADLVPAAAATTTRVYLEDSVTPGPKAWSLAQARRLEGKGVLERQQWQAAEAVLRQRIAVQSEMTGDSARLATTLAWLGSTDEAKQQIAPFEAAAREQPNNNSSYLLAQFYAALGDGARAAPYLQRAMFAHMFVTPQTLRLDPQWDKLRGQPAFDALLAISPASSSPIASPAPPAAAVSPARALANQALAILDGIDVTREDLALAEDRAQEAVKLDPSDAEAWAANSIANGMYVYRGWDTTTTRREQSRVMAARAIRLAPTSINARLAQAGSWATFNINRAETEKLLRGILEEHPDHQATLRFLAVVVLGRGQLDEALALNERSAALPGGDPLALYNNARYLQQAGRTEEAYATLNRSLAQNPFSSALVMKTLMEIYQRGDLDAAEATQRRIPPAVLLEDRANYISGLLRYYRRDAEGALKTWGSFPRDVYMDFQFEGPKGILLGYAYELDGRDAAAKIEWRTALKLADQRLAEAPNNPRRHYDRAHLLACLGETAAATEALRTYEQLTGVKSGAPRSFELALVYARLGRFDDLFAHWPAAPGRIRNDPRFDKVRADPRYAALPK